MTATAGVAGVAGITGLAGLTGGTPYVSYVLTLPKRADAAPPVDASADAVPTVDAGAGAVPTVAGGPAPAAEVAPLAPVAPVVAAAPVAAAAPVRQGIRRSGFTVSADGAYASCLVYRPERRGPGGPDPEDDSPGAGAPARADAGMATQAGAGSGSGSAAAVPGTAGSAAESRWCVERWTLRGPEAYAVPLPVDGPEDAGTPTLPLADGRVLVLRRAGDCHEVTLLYPSGTGTGQARAGSLPGPGVRLLPPCPAPAAAYALTWDKDRTVVWRVHGTAHGVPEPVMTLDGHCAGGVWLDRTGRLLALDQEIDGRAKSVAVDLYEGTARPLLHLTDDSDDRLLLADPDSGLLMLRSDATGETRLGWGVLGSGRPVRFPDALCVPGTLLTPVAVQPGQFLSAEETVVALRAEVPGGAASLALWRPGGKGVRRLPAPEGWLGPVALWLPGTPLRLPYAAEVTDAAPLPAAAAAHAVPAAADPEVRVTDSARSALGPAHPAPPRVPAGAADSSDWGLAAYDIPPTAAVIGTADRSGDGTAVRPGDGTGTADRSGDGSGTGGIGRARDTGQGSAGPDPAARSQLRAADLTTNGGARRAVRVVRDSRRALPLRRALAVLPLQQAPLAASLAAPAPRP